MEIGRLAVVTQRTSAVRTTILGGLVFLIPFVVLLAIAGKAYEVMRVIAQPIADAIGMEWMGAVLVVNAITALVTIVVCYVAGLLATKAAGQRLYRRVDDRLLDLFPRYSFLKALASGYTSDQRSTLSVVLVRLDDQSQVGFEVERDAEQVVVYLPGSPDPWSGAVTFVTPDRVGRLDVDFNTAVKKLRLAGRGALELIG